MKNTIHRIAFEDGTTAKISQVKSKGSTKYKLVFEGHVYQSQNQHYPNSQCTQFHFSRAK